MFSGGLDSSIIVRILCILLPDHEPIDLLSVSF